jgi:hypothetical protein
MRKLILAAALIGWLIPVPSATQGRAGIIAGTIRNSDRTPAQKVRIAVLEPSSGTAPAPALIVGVSESDDAGRYRLDRIPPGKYYVTAGRLNLPTYFPGTTDQAAARQVPVTADATSSDVDFIVAPESLCVEGLLRTSRVRIPGRFVIDKRPANAQMLQPGNVEALRRCDGLRVTAESEATGAFELTLEGGEYRISATAPRGYTVKAMTFDSVDLATQALKVDEDTLLKISRGPSNGARRPLDALAATTQREIVITLVPQAQTARR